MRVIYNGIDLGVTETISFSVVPVYDDTGTDYLYSKVSMTVRAVVNGQVDIVTRKAGNGPFLSYKLDNASTSITTSLTRTPGVLVTTGGGTGAVAEARSPDDLTPVTPSTTPFTTTPTGGSIKAGSGSLGGVTISPVTTSITHQAIRHRLSTPRGQLLVFTGDVQSSVNDLFLKSPVDGYVTDCKNGPSPKLLDVQYAYGNDITLSVVWSCETYINEGPLNSVPNTGALLSNRFAQRQIIDKNGYTTSFTAGVALFRTDFLYKLFQSPDNYRPVLFMPINPGCVREDIQVEGLPDVTGVSYSYRDRQIPVNFPAGPVIRAASISVYHRQAISSGALFGGALEAYERYMGLRANKHIADSPKVPDNTRPADVPHDRHGL